MREVYFAVNWSTSPANLREKEPGPNFSLNQILFAVTVSFQIFYGVSINIHFQLVHLTS